MFLKYWFGTIGPVASGSFLLRVSGVDWAQTTQAQIPLLVTLSFVKRLQSSLRQICIVTFPWLRELWKELNEKPFHQVSDAFIAEPDSWGDGGAWLKTTGCYPVVSLETGRTKLHRAEGSLCSEINSQHGANIYRPFPPTRHSRFFMPGLLQIGYICSRILLGQGGSSL